MALKKIQYDVQLLSTEKMLQGEAPVVYTNDLNSAEFVFNILDMTPEQLAGATATTLLYMRDGSFFQNSDVNLNGNTFTYLLKENEGNHGGLAKIQLVVKIGTAEYASQLYSFEVVSGLETKVAVEVMIHDWTTLLREARAYIAQFLLDEEGRQATFVANEQDRQLAFEVAEALRQQKETERQEAESGRIEAEQSRVDAEGTRQTTFTTNEANRTETFNANEATRQQAEAQRATAESVRVANEEQRISKDSERDSKIEAVERLQADIISGAVDSAAVQQHVEERYGQLEEEYAPRLTEVTTQLAQTQADFRDAVSKVTVDSEVILARTGITGIVHKTLDERLDFMERTAIDNDGLIFGVKWDKSANPTLVRTDSAIGLVANVGKDTELVRNDFDNVPIYRDIEDVTDAYGNEFVKIPKFYIQKTEDASTMRIRISKTRYPGFYLPKVFWDFENYKELDYYLHGKYKGNLSADGTKLESRFGEYPLINRSIVQFRALAQANNTLETKGYQQLDIHAQDVLSTLFTIEFATLNSQSVMQGYTTGRHTNSDIAVVSETATNRIVVANGTANQYRVGQAISIGTSQGGNQVFYGRAITAIKPYDANNSAILFDGSPVNVTAGNMLYNTGWKNGFSRGIAASSGYIVANDGKYPCSYRGIESPWGNLWQWVDGINIIDNQSWVAENAADYVSNKFEIPYQKLAYVNSLSNGWVSRLGFDAKYPYANIPTEISAGSATYYADYHYQSTGERVALVGGIWNYSSNAGLWYWTLNASSGSVYINIGGRLLKKAL